MQGVLKPASHAHDVYSQGNTYYNASQYPQTPQTVPAQQPQSNSWPAPVETPYYPSTGSYGTTSAQYSQQYSSGAYATPEQPSSASQYHGYDQKSNSYTYPDPTHTPSFSQQHAGASEDPESPNPGSAQRNDGKLYEPRNLTTVHDLDELMVSLQAQIDASFIDGVHECLKTELTLGGDAFVPLMRPNIGPYADGGNQDLPTDFKANIPADTEKEQESSQETQTQPQDQSQDGSHEQSQDQPQAPPQDQPGQDGNAPTTQTDNGSTETQSAASAPATQPPSKPTVPEPEDPLKRCPNATVDCILNIADADVRAIVQRAASRGLVQRIVNLDGYKYMFNNFWTSRVDGDGLRFSYICRDSLQNKDRFAHVPARPTTAAPSVRGPVPRRTKESWDCKGSISIKFSQAVGAIIVQYRHAAVHPTHASRKRPPRKPAAPKSSRPPGRPKGSSTKRKRDSEVGGYAPATGGVAAAMLPAPLPNAPRYAQPAPREPSLFDLLQQSAAENAVNEDGAQLGDASRPWWTNA